ncbi:DNA polymerase III subunit alpha [Patescibacteria group bacterium]|nr:DNA polymerase III subunit alpha [Patescibacteria group bacterium]
MSFIHLHVHSHYSLLDGLSRFNELIEIAQADGANAVALTDHGVMYGIIEFYQACKKAGIKPIVGFEAYMAKGSMLEKVTKQDEKRNYHILLLARNNQGYKNLIKLTSIAHLEGFYYKPRIDWETLQKYSEGLIACSACLGGEIPQLILSDKYDKAKKRAQEHEELFGKGHYYLEIQPHPTIPEQDQVNQKIIQIARETGIPLVATNDLHYLKPDDYDAQDVLLCLQTKAKKNDVGRFSLHGKDFYYKSEQEMREAFLDVQEAVDNTQVIADMCDVEIELGNIQLPSFEVPEGFDDFTYLEKICHDGLLVRYEKDYNNVDEEVRTRLDFELSVIKKMGWPSYFSIVADFVMWAKNRGIAVGPGRGSAAGSLVCYVIGITNLDPIKYELLFERFLNPERVSMPDIDMDFSDNRREEVLRYVEQKYGKDHVAQIITFGTMAARVAIRDVGRVLDIPLALCDKLAKLVPMFSTLSDALENTAEFKDLYDKDPQAKQIVDFSLRLEGVARHASTHACGVLITKNPLTDYTPLQFGSQEGGDGQRGIVSQYSLHPVEDLGLLKMDFLGLKNLTIIESAIRIIKESNGVEIDIEKIPLDDKLAYKLFQDGETTGVFQFESSGMKRYLKDLKPTELEDIIAMVALYRPGPMEWIPDFIAGKHGTRTIQYLHPKLEPILRNTYGVAIYQEQVMRMARDLAGFSMGQADVLRKAMGKKIVKLLAEQKDKFLNGCEDNNIDRRLAEQIFSFIEPFAGYGFNRSHAACYAMIGYQTAYLKAHYPAEFMAALLTADQQHIDRISIEIDECKEMGIDVLQPNVNKSFESFTVVKNTETGKKEIRFGLRAIKNVGTNISEFIIKERIENGEFLDLSDLLERVINRDMNKKSLDSLIKCGAMDDFGDRGKLIANMDNLLEFSKEVGKLKANNQNSLFGDVTGVNSINKVRLDKTGVVEKQDKLRWEKELLGLYITEHPFNEYRKYLEGFCVNLLDLQGCIDETDVTIAGIISTIKKITTKAGDPMLFVRLEDHVGSTEILVFPRIYAETQHIWQAGNIIACYGKISDKDNERKVLANKVIALSLDAIDGQMQRFKTEIPQKGAKPAYRASYIKKDNSLKLIFVQKCSPEHLSALKLILDSNRGSDKVYLKIFNGDGHKIVETNFLVSNGKALVDNIATKFDGIIKVA